MAERLENTEDLHTTKTRYGSFADRYPDYPSWLDGATWQLDLATDIKEPLHRFRASLYYQATVMGLKLATKVRTLAGGRQVLLVRAYEAPNAV